MRKNPVRTAWTILLLASCICCLLAVSVPLASRWYLLTAEVAIPSILKVASGTVLLVPEDTEEPLAVVDSRPVDDNTLIQTDQSSQATLVFLTSEEANSPELATVQIYTNAQVRLLHAGRPRYALSQKGNHIILEVMGGRVRVNTTENSAALHTEVRTPQAVITLQAGSYAVAVTNDQTQVSTRTGLAVVQGTDETQVSVSDGMSSLVNTGQLPTQPIAATENLISDGEFIQPLGPPRWLVSRYPEDDPSAGNVEITMAGGRQAARFSRINQPPTHTEVAITQVLDHPVHDYQYLNLEIDVLLRWQSLPGAGEQSSEFPLMLWLDYQDAYGNHQFWTHGFYYRDPPSQWVVTGGEKVPQGSWFPFESGNLFQRLPMEGRPAPARINWLRIYASGHNYDSLVSEVRMIAR